MSGRYAQIASRGLALQESIMADKGEKNNAMRLLDSRHIAYTVHHWVFAPDQHAAGEVAAQLDMPPAQVFKTLVVLSPVPKAKPLLVIVGGDREVDLKKLAAAAGEKKLAMATQREAESLTGLQVGGISALGYDANYNVAVATDALGRSVKYARNANGDPEAVTDALGNTSRIEYQPKLEYEDASGPKTDYYSRPVKITDALGRVTKLDYDSYGNLSKAEDALGNKTAMKYDRAGHLLELRDAVGSAYKYEYAMGLTKSVDPLGRVTRYQRDADLRVTVLTDPLGRNTSFTYDLGGNVTAAANPAGFVTKFAYGLGGCPSCAGGQLSALTDPKGNTWSFDYDQYGRLAGAANPLGQKKSYAYDRMSRVTEVADPAGNVTAYTYDALNRLTRKQVRSPSGGRSVTDYSYDAVGNLLKAANGEGAVSYTYDALDRPVEAVQYFGGKVYTIGYAYDAVGNRTAMKTPWGGFTYTYDALNRLTGLVNPQGVTVNFKYDAAGRRVKKSVFKAAPALLAETDYAYDAAGQLLAITNKAGGKVVAFNNYEYDLAGNRVLKKDQDGVTRYGYDKSNRLITVEPVPAYIPGEEAFIYDKNGNRRFDKGAKDYKYDAANRLQANTVYAYTHDVNGNLTGRTHKAGGTSVTYAYNLEQQLAEVLTPEHKLQYRYDPLGRRIERFVNGSPTHYVYDNEDIIAMLDGEGKVLQTFTHGPGIDEPLIMTKADGANYYYHADGLGSIAALTDDNSKIVETYSYKAYGQPKLKNAKGEELTASAVGNPYLFTARELDSESGLYYYRARYYEPTRGAFTQEDPTGIVGSGLNLFVYAMNAPQNYIDPLGLKCKKPFWDRVSENFIKTNQIIPGVSAPPGLGLVLGASKTVAQTTGFLTAGQWFSIGLRGASLGSATFTTLETGVLVGVNSLYTTMIVGVSYEAGVGVGSVISALIFPCEEEVCPKSRR